jgi:hypothetical protein
VCARIFHYELFAVGVFDKAFYFVALHPGAQCGLILDEQIMTVGTLLWSSVDANKIVQVQLALKRRESTGKSAKLIEFINISIVDNARIWLCLRFIPGHSLKIFGQNFLGKLFWFSNYKSGLIGEEGS